MKTIIKMKKEEKKVYHKREGAPFKDEDAQEIGEFIESCKDKSTKGILEEVKKHPESKIYSLFEWDKDKAAELYQLQRVREIVSHLEVKIIRIGNREPVMLDVSISAFKSVRPRDSDERVFASSEEIMNDDYLREQVVMRAKIELKNWMERYNQYKELETIIRTIRNLLN